MLAFDPISESQEILCRIYRVRSLFRCEPINRCRKIWLKGAERANTLGVVDESVAYRRIWIVRIHHRCQTKTVGPGVRMDLGHETSIKVVPSVQGCVLAQNHITDRKVGGQR